MILLKMETQENIKKIIILVILNLIKSVSFHQHTLYTLKLFTEKVICSHHNLNRDKIVEFKLQLQISTTKKTSACRIKTNDSNDDL
mgnify:CR=1 FL=1